MAKANEGMNLPLGSCTLGSGRATCVDPRPPGTSFELTPGHLAHVGTHHRLSVASPWPNVPASGPEKHDQGVARLAHKHWPRKHRNEDAFSRPTLPGYLANQLRFDLPRIHRRVGSGVGQEEQQDPPSEVALIRHENPPKVRDVATQATNQ
ncbi:hypothetical protein OG21DRAFT_1523005 [Imleria badia]|nr:hypothetical protein OG21DRAFT_1523005 [Imleria badia]